MSHVSHAAYSLAVMADLNANTTIIWNLHINIQQHLFPLTISLRFFLSI